jgi:mono/diheme cytochrome c family protein
MKHNRAEFQHPPSATGGGARQRRVVPIGVTTLLAAGSLALAGCGGGNDDGGNASTAFQDAAHAFARGGAVDGSNVGPVDRAASTPQQVSEGQNIFRYWTFGDEQVWTDALQMNQVIQSAVDPATALSVGLKVDMDALPPAVVNGVLGGTIPLNDPQTTLALIQLNAVLGIKGEVSKDPTTGKLQLDRVGITCALCHSTVDNAANVATNGALPNGIGHRHDGWPNRDLNPGAIIALSPAVDQSGKVIRNNWGAGFYDPRNNVDGKFDNSMPHGLAAVIPPAFGLNDVHSITFTGDGSELAYWNRYVGVTQMGGQGVFADPRLPDPLQNGGKPIDRDQRGTGLDCVTDITVNGTAIKIASQNITGSDGRVDCTSNYLPALQAYQQSLPAPTPADVKAAAGFTNNHPIVAANLAPNPNANASNGQALFAKNCATCHNGPAFTDANAGLHPGGDSVATDQTYLERSASKMWRTSPLPGLSMHPPYFHDGSAASLADVVTTYNTKRNLNLSAQDQLDLVEYLKSF